MHVANVVFYLCALQLAACQPESDAAERLPDSESAGLLSSAGVGDGATEVGNRAAARNVEVTEVIAYPGESSARLVVRLDQAAQFRLRESKAESESAPKLFLDIARATYAGQAVQTLEGLVQTVRVYDQLSGVRVALGLSRPAEYRVFYLPEPFRLVIDLFLPNPSDAAPASGRRSIRRVVLDPGHGGADPGALGPVGLQEKDVTLDIAHRAAPLLARELGISTLLTRDTDTFVALDERAAMANAFNADLFISIHCNASEDGQGRGTMTFVLDTSGDVGAARLAARENAASLDAGHELANSLATVLDARTRAESLRLARLLQTATSASLAPYYPKIQNHGVKRAGFYVLAGAQMPAVLFEASFISNHGEERLLQTGHFRQRLADAIVNAVRAYRDGY